MSKKNKYITVLDFEDGKVYQYEVPTVINELITQHGAASGGEDYEYYLSGLSHNLSNCEWMVHDSPGVITP